MKQHSVVALFLSLVVVLHAQAQSTYIWKPVGSSTSAKVPGNWKISTCNGSAATVLPGSGDTLLFSNCSAGNAVLDTTFHVAYIHVKSNYSGTISRSGSFTLTSQKMKVSGGTFSGGSNAITLNGTLTIDGGTFAAPTGLLTVRGNFSNTGGTFTHNSGTVKFQNETTGQLSISSSSKTSGVDFYDVVLDASDTSATFRVNSMLLTVNHSLLISGDEQLFINGDTILMTGGSTLTLTNTSNTGGGTAKIKFSGSATQSITGNTGTDYTKLPNVVINKSGTLNMSGNIGLGGSAYLHYHAGTISEGTSSFLFYYNDTIKGAMTFYDLEFAGHSSNFYLTDTIIVNHDLNLSGTAYSQVNNGGIKLYNNLSYTNSHSSSVLNTTIQFSNVSAGQSVLGTHSVVVDKLVMNNTGQTLILQKPTTVKYYLVLNNGFIRSDATNLLTLAAGSIVINGSSTSFVKGPIKKIGNTAFAFPIGKETSFKKLAITAPANLTDAYTAEYFNAEQNLGEGKDTLTYLSDCEYWNLTRTTGTSSVKVTLYWDNTTCDIYTLQTLRIARWDGTKWNNTGMVTTSGSTSSGTVQTNSDQGSFGYFMIAKRSPSVIANAGTVMALCPSGSGTIGGSPTASGGISPYTYLWSPSTGLNSSTVANPSASPDVSTDYILTVTDLDRSISKDTVHVSVCSESSNMIKSLPIGFNNLNSIQQSHYTQLSNNGFEPIHLVQIGTLNDVSNEGTVTVNLDFLACPNLVYNAKFSRYQSESDYSWTSSLIDTIGWIDTTSECHFGTLTLCAIDGNKSGTLILDTITYKIVDLTGGIAAMFPLALIGFDCVLPNEEESVEEGDNREEEPCDEDKLRILVLYTQKAEDSGFDPISTAEQSIVSLQGIWVNSQIYYSNKVELAGVIPYYTYTEGTSIELYLLDVEGDGQLSTWRDLYDADLLVILTYGQFGDDVGLNNSKTVNNVIVPDKNLFLSVLEIDYAVSTYFVFAHEVGHSFGANHGYYENNSYGNGLKQLICNTEYNPECWWSGIILHRRWVATVMYAPWINKKKQNKIDYFSNPDLEYQGEKIGEEDEADNHRKLIDEYEYVSGYMPDISTTLMPSIVVDVPPPCEEDAYADGSVICGTPPYSYQWKKSTNGGVSFTTIAGATSSSYAYENLVDNKTYCLQLIVTDANNETASIIECFFVPDCCNACQEKLSLANRESNNFKVSLTPTLGTGKMLLRIDNADQETSFSGHIVSLLGQEIQTMNFKMDAGTTSFPITVNVASGIYYLQIVSAGFVKTVPFVISTEP